MSGLDDQNLPKSDVINGANGIGERNGGGRKLEGVVGCALEMASGDGDNLTEALNQALVEAMFIWGTG